MDDVDYQFTGLEVLFNVLKLSGETLKELSLSTSSFALSMGHGELAPLSLYIIAELQKFSSLASVEIGLPLGLELEAGSLPGGGKNFILSGDGDSATHVAEEAELVLELIKEVKKFTRGLFSKVKIGDQENCLDGFSEEILEELSSSLSSIQELSRCFEEWEANGVWDFCIRCYKLNSLTLNLYRPLKQGEDQEALQIQDNIGRTSSLKKLDLRSLGYIIPWGTFIADWIGDELEELTLHDGDGEDRINNLIHPKVLAALLNKHNKVLIKLELRFLLAEGEEFKDFKAGYLNLDHHSTKESCSLEI